MLFSNLVPAFECLCCRKPTILPLSVCFCAKGTSPEWGMQPTLWDGNQPSLLGPNANPHLRSDQNYSCVLELCLTTLCSSLIVCEPTLDVPFNNVLHKLTNYTALVCLLFRVEDIHKGVHAAFTLGPLTDPIVPPGQYWVWMGPTLVHSRVPCKTQWSRPPLRQQDKTRHPLHLILISGDTKTAGPTDPTPKTAQTSLETPVSRNSDQVCWSDPTGETKRFGTGTQTALHGLIREPTNTPEILSPTTKTPTQCFILSPTIKWLPRYGDCTITYSHAIPYANQTSRPYLAAPAARAVPHLSARHLTWQSSIYPDTKAAGKTPRSGIQLVGTKCKT
eukprot:g81344.t1